jgi:hypothetical protein
VAPEHDQFTTPEALRTLVASWTNTEIVELSGVDHFMATGTDELCAQVLAQMLETL